MILDTSAIKRKANDDRQKGDDATSQEDADRDGALKTRKKMAARMLELSKYAHAYINLRQRSRDHRKLQGAMQDVQPLCAGAAKDLKWSTLNPLTKKRPKRQLNIT